MIQFCWKDLSESSQISPLLGFGTWEFQEFSRTLTFDPLAWKILGIEPSEKLSLNESVQNLFGTEQLKSLLDHWSKSVNSESSFRLKSNPQDKAPRYFTLRGGPVQGKIQGLIWDSTLENQKIELALEGSGFGVWTFDPQSEKLVWDDKMYCIYGHTRETFNESPGTWASCLHPEDVDLVSERFAELIKGKPVNIFEFRIVRHSDKLERIIEANGTSQIDSSGNVRLVVGMNRDITDHKLKLQEMEKQEKQLAQANKMAELGAMAAGIAHEINSPLSVVVGKAEFLLRKSQIADFTFSQAAKDVEKILQVSSRIGEIVRGLKNYSRNSDNDPFSLTPLQEMIDDTLSLTRDRFKTEKIQVNLQLGDLAQTQLACRPAQLIQVFLNLLNNAVDATQFCENKQITIRAEQKDSWLRIAFQDNGTGVPVDVAEKIFEPFYSTKAPGQGTGLGLSIARTLTEAHKGRLTLGTADGQTCFQVDLPISENLFNDPRPPEAFS